MMNVKSLVLFGLCAAITGSVAVVSAAHRHKSVTRRGTSVMHYLIRNNFMHAEGRSNIVGQLRLQCNEQGKSAKQMLRLHVRGLRPDATYSLTANIRGYTNSLWISDFETDRRGRAIVRYKWRSHPNHSNHRPQKNPLPELLSPLTDVRAFGIENARTQTVAYAWIADSHRFHYLVKRNLTPDDEEGNEAGSISLIANHNRVRFRLLAGGLEPNHYYHLRANRRVLRRVRADMDGYLSIMDWPERAPDVLDLRHLSLADRYTNDVLSVDLPK